MNAMFRRAVLLLMAGSLSGRAPLARAHVEKENRRFVQVSATTREERTALANAGMSIEAVRSDSVWGFADPATLERIQSETKLKVMGNFPLEVGRGGHGGILDFPAEDARYHNAAELLAKLRDLNKKNVDITSLIPIGKTVEGRDIWAFHINTTPEAHATTRSGKPGAIFMGNHRAREHLSLEIPLMLIEHLLANREDPKIANLLETRDLWIIPQVNPDGAEYDIATGKYEMWRKNRAKNADGSMGVDLNRNYGFRWGTGGSSNQGSNDTFMGTKPFSEPETQAIRDFVSSQPNAKVLLTFHTFSELILYPWGHKYDSVEEKRDLAVFEKMAKTMAGWNKYKPQQASDLYIASGDTTDWAYGERGIFAFTFELSPKGSFFDGGESFYPGPKIIDRVFNDNLQPCLYMIELADDPYKILDPSVNYADFGRITPDLSTIGKTSALLP